MGTLAKECEDALDSLTGLAERVSDVVKSLEKLLADSVSPNFDEEPISYQNGRFYYRGKLFTDCSRAERIMGFPLLSSTVDNLRFTAAKLPKL